MLKRITFSKLSFTFLFLTPDSTSEEVGQTLHSFQHLEKIINLKIVFE